MHTKHGIRRNFARRAATYDAHAQVQRRMADALVCRCEAAVVQSRSILEIGCGTGYLTQVLRRFNPGARLVAVDLDVRLIQAARARLDRDPRTAWLVADGETLSRGAFDLIISNSTFQWFTEPGATLQRLRERLTPGGYLAFTAMGPTTFRELAAALKDATRNSNLARYPEIAAERFLTGTDWQSLLTKAGFNGILIETELITVDFPSVQDFLASLQATGTTNPRPHVLAPRLLKTMIASYEAGFAVNGSIPATYELIWTMAAK
jgi:malonyl-CoA O-methyltransferase